jgi:hypothetical protein
MISTAMMTSRRVVSSEVGDWASIGYGLTAAYEPMTITESNVVSALSETQAIVVYRADGVGKVRVIENDSGTDITAGPSYSFAGTAPTGGYGACALTSTTAIITYTKYGSPNIGVAVLATITPGTKEIAFGSPFTFEASASASSTHAARISDTKALITYRAIDSGTINSYGKAVVVDAAGTVGTTVVFDIDNLMKVESSMLSVSGFITLYSKFSFLYAIYGEISGTTITFPESAVKVSNDILNGTSHSIAALSSTLAMVCFSSATTTKALGLSVSAGVITPTLETAINDFPASTVCVIKTVNNQSLLVFKSYEDGVYANMTAAIISYGTIYPIMTHKAPFTTVPVQYLGLTKMSDDKSIFVFRVASSSPYYGAAKMLYSD